MEMQDEEGRKVLGSKLAEDAKIKHLRNISTEKLKAHSLRLICDNVLKVVLVAEGNVDVDP